MEQHFEYDGRAMAVLLLAHTLFCGSLGYYLGFVKGLNDEEHECTEPSESAQQN